MVSMRTKLDPRYEQPSKTIFHDPIQLGQILKLRRKELGYTQTDIAEFMGCSQRLISEIERGKPTVAFETILRMANGLGIDFIASIRGK